MKKLCWILPLILATALFGADAANDLLLTQRNSTNDDNVARNVTASASALLAFDGSLVPTTVAIGTTTGTVAAGDDSRITGAAQKASNLSDLASATTARTNLGVGTGDSPSFAALTASTGSFTASTSGQGLSLHGGGTVTGASGAVTIAGNTSITGTASVATVGVVNKLSADGTFETSDLWTLGANWSIGTSKATHAVGSEEDLVGQAYTTIGGTLYQVNFTVSGRTAGNLLPKLSNNTAGLTSGIVADGAYSVYIIASGDAAALIFSPSSDFDGSVDGVTIYAVTPSTADASIISSNGTSFPIEFRSVGSASYSLGIGTYAARSSTTGKTTAIGYGAAANNVTGSVTAMGFRAGNANLSGNGVFIGEDAGLNTLAGNITAVGHNSLSANTRGVGVGVGYRSGYSNTTGVITAIGDEAGYNNTTGYFTGVGYVVGRANTTGNFTGFGHYAGRLSTADFSGFGFTAGYSNTTGDFTGFGYEVGYSNTTGTFTGFGRKAGYANTTGTLTALGYEAGRYNTTGSLIAVGYLSGSGAVTTNAPATDTFGILIGNSANRSVATATALTNYIGIGYGVLIDKSNQVKIGNSSITETVLYGNLLTGAITSTFTEAVSSFTRTGLNGAGTAAAIAMATDAKTAGDAISLAFGMKDSGSANQNYASIRSTIVDPTAGSEDGSLTLSIVAGGSSVDVLTLTEGLASLSSGLKVGSTTSAALTATTVGHLASQGTAPTAVVGAAAGTTPSAVTITGHDTAFTLALTTGTSCPSSGVLTTLTFNTAFAAAPHVVFCGGGANGAAAMTKVYSTSTTTTFVLSVNAALTDATTYTFECIAVQ